MTSHLTPFFGPTGWEGGKRRENREREDFRERSSTFCLDFPTIGPSNPGEARGKIDFHCKGYAWVSGLKSFEKLREVGVFSYLVNSLAKSHPNGWGCSRA